MNLKDKNTNTVNNQIVLRDTSNGMSVRTHLKAGLKYTIKDVVISG